MIEEQARAAAEAAAYTPPVANEPTYTPVVSSDGGGWQGRPDLGRDDREASSLEASRGLAFRELLRDAGVTDLAAGWSRAEDRRRFEAHRNLVFGVDAPLTAEEANDRYGVEGRLTFDRPVSDAIAAWQSGVARRELFRDEVVSNANVAWWEAMGVGFAGALLDPVGAPLWLIPELAAGRAIRGAAAASRLSRFGAGTRGAITGAVEGLAGGVVYEGANLWLHHEAASDYDLGQASANILLGGLLGAGAGTVGGWWSSRSGRVPRAPAVVEAMDDTARTGALIDALDAMIEDRPVDLGPGLRRQAEAGRLTPRETMPPLRALDDAATPDGGAAAARWIDDRYGEVAVTPRGREVPVRFALMEAADLVTSHDDDLFRNIDYPADLQPRQRGRAGAQARNRALEAELNPRRLISDVGAETGAPIVSADGVVESGNGRTIALRRSAATGSGAYDRYRAELEAQGLDTSGMERPVLVRVRQEPLDGEARVRLTREMNAEATEAYSPSERAAADAEAVDDELLALVEGPDLQAAGNRRFVRAFMERVAPDDLNRMTTGDGRLSEAGLDRISAAMVARAYGDRALVEALFEATDSHIKAIGRALADAAPEWAAMRAAVTRGEAPAALDPTEALTAAVNFVRHVRARGGNLAETLELTVGQFDAFDGAAMTPETEAFVRSFFRTSPEGATLWKSPRSAASLSDGLRWLATEIRKAEPGPNLFGEVADVATGRQLLDAFGRWFARTGDEGQPAPGLDFGPDATAVPKQPAGGNVRPAGDAAGREPRRQGAGREASELVGGLPPSGLLEAGKPRVPKGQVVPPKGDPFVDPEIAALMADTDGALLRAGLDPADIVTPEGQDPQTVADAIAAGAFCLKGGG